jgi:ubiquinone/menaquinone biosynthesis C-methylase UbiE
MSPTQCERPRGLLGKGVLWLMNLRHSSVTDWGLSHVTIKEDDIILDVGCGGGRTVSKLATRASKGKTYGIDNSEESVAWARKTNRQLTEMGRVEIQLASVSQMPFPGEVFDLVTAVETHFWWTDIGAGMREAFRVLKPRGRMIIVAEMYNGGKHAKYIDMLSKVMTMAFLSVDQHRAIFADAGFTDVEIDEERTKGWISAKGTKPKS